MSCVQISVLRGTPVPSEVCVVFACARSSGSLAVYSCMPFISCLRLQRPFITQMQAWPIGPSANKFEGIWAERERLVSSMQVKVCRIWTMVVCVQQQRGSALQHNVDAKKKAFVSKLKHRENWSKRCCCLYLLNKKGMMLSTQQVWVPVHWLLEIVSIYLYCQGSAQQQGLIFLYTYAWQ